MRKLALAPLSLLPHGPVEQFDAALAAGFEFTGLRLVPVSPTDPVFLDDAATRRELAARVRDGALRVLDIEVFRIGPATGVGGLERALDFGASLAARHALFTLPLRTEGRVEDEDASVAKLVEFCDLAGTLGIRPMLEFMKYRLAGTLADAVRVVRKARHPNLGICVDSLHLFRSRGTPDEVRALDASLMPYAQWCDAPAAMPSDDEIPREARYGRMIPGDGGLPLRALLAALPTQAALSVEVPRAWPAGTPARDVAKALADATRQWLGAAEPSRSTAYARSALPSN